MADSMPAKTAQTPLQPGAASGSANVTPNTPLEATDPITWTPNPITNAAPTSQGGSGSPLVSPASPLSASKGIYNGGQGQGQRNNPAWPAPKQDQGSSGDAPNGALDMDVRVIPIPQAPHASQSNGAWHIGDGDR